MSQKYLFLLTEATAMQFAPVILQQAALDKSQIYVLYDAKLQGSLSLLGVPEENTACINQLQDAFAAIFASEVEVDLIAYFIYLQAYYQLIANLLNGQDLALSEGAATNLEVSDFVCYVHELQSVLAQGLANHPATSTLHIIEGGQAAYLGSDIPVETNYLAEFSEFYEDYPQATYNATGLPPYISANAYDLVSLVNRRVGTAANPIIFHRSNLAAFFWINNHYQNHATRVLTYNKQLFADLSAHGEFFHGIAAQQSDWGNRQAGFTSRMRIKLWVFDDLTSELLSDTDFQSYVQTAAKQLVGNRQPNLMLQFGSKVSAKRQEVVRAALEAVGAQVRELPSNIDLLPDLLQLPPCTVTVYGLLAKELIYALLAQQEYVTLNYLVLQSAELNKYLEQCNYNFSALLKSFANNLPSLPTEQETIKEWQKEYYTKFIDSLWSKLLGKARNGLLDEFQGSLKYYRTVGGTIVLPNIMEAYTLPLEYSEHVKEVLSQCHNPAKDIDPNSIYGDYIHGGIVPTLLVPSKSQLLKANSYLSKPQQDLGTVDHAAPAGVLQTDNELLQAALDHELLQANALKLTPEQLRKQAALLRLAKEQALAGSASDLHVLAKAQNLVTQSKAALKSQQQSSQAKLLSGDELLSVAYYLALEQERQAQDLAKLRPQNPFVAVNMVYGEEKPVVFALDFWQKLGKYQEQALTNFSQSKNVVAYAQASQVNYLPLVKHPEFPRIVVQNEKDVRSIDWLALSYFLQSFLEGERFTGAIVVYSDTIESLELAIQYIVNKGYGYDEIICLTQVPEMFHRNDTYHAIIYIDVRPYLERLAALPYFNLEQVLAISSDLFSRVTLLTGSRNNMSLLFPYLGSQLLIAFILSPLVKEINLLSTQEVDSTSDFGLGLAQNLAREVQKAFTNHFSQQLLLREKPINNIVNCNLYPSIPANFPRTGQQMVIDFKNYYIPPLVAKPHS